MEEVTVPGSMQMIMPEAEDMSPERLLWSAVIERFVRDVSGARSEREAKKLVKYTRSEEFDTVCEYAGYDSGYVRSGVLRMARSVWVNASLEQ